MNPRPPASSGSTATAGSLYSSPGPANGNSLEIHDSENGLKEIGEELVICSADVLTSRGILHSGYYLIMHCTLL